MKSYAELVKAFTTYVRPIVEYASCIWSPHTARLTKNLNLYSVELDSQSVFLCCSNLTYNVRLVKLHLDSLELPSITSFTSRLGLCIQDHFWYCLYY